MFWFSQANGQGSAILNADRVHLLIELMTKGIGIVKQNTTMLKTGGCEYSDLCVCVWGGMLLEPLNPYPVFRVILSEKGYLFYRDLSLSLNVIQFSLAQQNLKEYSVILTSFLILIRRY